MFKSNNNCCYKRVIDNEKTYRAYWKDEASIIFLNNSFKKIKCERLNEIIDYINNPANTDLDMYLFLIRESNSALLANGRTPLLQPLFYEDQNNIIKNAIKLIINSVTCNKSSFVEYLWNSELINKIYKKRAYVRKFKIDDEYYILGTGYPLLII